MTQFERPTFSIDVMPPIRGVRRPMSTAPALRALAAVLCLALASAAGLAASGLRAAPSVIVAGR